MTKNRRSDYYSRTDSQGCTQGSGGWG